MSNAVTNEVDFIFIGCPHCLIDDMKRIAGLLSGKKVHSGVTVWILTSAEVKTFADKMGYLKVIEASGARVIADTCPVNMPRKLLERQGHKVMATNSPKIGLYMLPIQGVLAHYGSLQQCIDASLTGIWG
jgi:predicted aconitase